MSEVLAWVGALPRPGPPWLVAALLAIAAWGASAPAAGAAPRGPALRLRIRRSPRRAGDQGDRVEAMDLLALALDAGGPLEASLREVAAVVGGDCGAELNAVAAALSWGLDDAEAWEAAGATWAPAASALTLARRAGVPPVALLRAAADDERRGRAAAAQDAAGVLPVRLVLPLGLLFLPAFVLTTVLPVVLVLAGDLLSGP
jgi:pilus assembly protein TadC